MIILHFTWFIFCFSTFADMLCNERLHYITHTTKTLNSLSTSTLPAEHNHRGMKRECFSSFFFLCGAHLQTTKNAAKWYSSQKQFWRMVINQLNVTYLAYSDIAEHISSFSGKKKNTFFPPPRLIKNTHACSSLLKVSSQQVVDSVDNKAVMGRMRCRESGGEWSLIRAVWAGSQRFTKNLHFFHCLFSFFLLKLSHKSAHLWLVWDRHSCRL